MQRRSFVSHFEEDPFFGLPKNRFSSFDDFFANDPFHHQHGHFGGAIQAPQQNERALNRFDNRTFSPFGLCSNYWFPSRDRAFRWFDENMAGDVNDPSAHSYSHSSVMTYSTGDDGQPKYYEATSSTRNAPGGIKETRRTVRDSERELAKMAIGRHIGDRGHMMEKSENTKTGQREERQDFMGLDQGQLPTFDREWQEKTQVFQQRGALGGSGNQQDTRAIENGKKRK